MIWGGRCSYRWLLGIPNCDSSFQNQSNNISSPSTKQYRNLIMIWRCIVSENLFIVRITITANEKLGSKLIIKTLCWLNKSPPSDIQPQALNTQVYLYIKISKAFPLGCSGRMVRIIISGQAAPRSWDNGGKRGE
jgi:hypothetical protein